MANKDENNKPGRKVRGLRFQGPLPEKNAPTQSSRQQQEEQEMTIEELNNEMLTAAASGDTESVMALVQRGANVKYEDPRFHATVLHRAASVAAKELIMRLAEECDLDYLVKDHKGRFPSALAAEVAEDPELTAFLMEKEIAQAERDGLEYRALLISEPPNLNGPG